MGLELNYNIKPKPSVLTKHEDSPCSHIYIRCNDPVSTSGNGLHQGKTYMLMSLKNMCLGYTIDLSLKSVESTNTPKSIAPHKWFLLQCAKIKFIHGTRAQYQWKHRAGGGEKLKTHSWMITQQTTVGTWAQTGSSRRKFCVYNTMASCLSLSTTHVFVEALLFG